MVSVLIVEVQLLSYVLNFKCRAGEKMLVWSYVFNFMTISYDMEMKLNKISVGDDKFTPIERFAEQTYSLYPSKWYMFGFPINALDSKLQSCLGTLPKWIWGHI